MRPKTIGEESALTAMEKNSGMPRFASIRVIGALMLREMTTRYGKSVGGYFWAFAEPVGMIAILSVVFGLAVRNPSLGTNFPLFFATGYLTFHFYNELAQFASSAIARNRPLLNYPRVTPIDAIIARCALQFATITVTSIVILGGIIWFYEINTIIDYVAMVKATLYAALLGIGTGVMNTYIFVMVPTYQNVWKIMSRPLLLISGVFFIVEDMPRAMQDILWWNPIVHATGM
ncbi:MAG: ABC transporter permease, partial [Pseudomonadota bacterium]